MGSEPLEGVMMRFRLRKPKRPQGPIGQAVGQTRSLDECVVGWKLALANYRDDLGSIRFAPIQKDGIVTTCGAHDTAECQQRPWHIPPNYDCRCGFSAWRDRRVNDRLRLSPELRDARDVTRNGALVELRVKLYGNVAEGVVGQSKPWAYRGAYQLVTDVLFTPQCYCCGNLAVAVGLVRLDYAFGWDLHPVCISHSRSQKTVSFESLEQTNNPVAFHWKTS